MPPVVLDPQNNGVTSGNSYSFSNANAHGIHPATSVLQWKVTVTTGLNNGGTLITESGWSNQPIGACILNNLPANNNWYYGQVVYVKTTGGQFVSSCNKFQSLP
jgi:hypothetical protein